MAFLLASLALAALASTASPPQGSGLHFEETFEGAVVSDDGSLVSSVGRFVVEGEGQLAVMQPRPWADGNLALRLPGGERTTTVLEVASGAALGGTLQFVCQRDGRRKPFELTVILVDRDGMAVRHELTNRVNAKEAQTQLLQAPPGLVQVSFVVTAPAKRGVWIDDVRFLPPAPMEVESMVFEPMTRPLVDGEWSMIGEVAVRATGSLAPLEVTGLRVTGGAGARSAPSEHVTDVAGSKPEPDGVSARLGEHHFAGGARQLSAGLNTWPVWVRSSAAFSAEPAAWGQSLSHGVALGFGEEWIETTVPPDQGAAEAWPGSRMTPRALAVDAVSLVAAPLRPRREEVLLCAVSSVEGGVVLYRSTDGGASWLVSAAPKGADSWSEGALVMDLLDDEMHLVADGRDGLVHSRSLDRGLTWSEPKVLGGLGPRRVSTAGCSGIRVSTGELVIPVIVYGGFRIPDEPCAGILYSRDQGATWQLPPAAFPNTTTAAVIEVGPGALLLNMTDGRGALRSERSTRTLGESWSKRTPLSLEDYHDSAGGDGALIHLGRARGKGWDSRFVFANASTRRSPLRNMQLKGSSDNGTHWPVEHRVLLDDGVGVDHPSLAPVGASDVGIAYECSAGGVVFQRVPEVIAVPKVASWFDVTGGR